MAIFLNREGIIKHFDRLFNEAKGEVVMVVPYISLTAEILTQLKVAEDNGVEVLIVYRENKLVDEEKRKLFSFKNITLLHHPNVHAKCYLNDDSLIICSMNLYEHSIKNNREMGVLLDFFSDEVCEKENLNETWSIDDQAIEKCLEEIQIILNASTVEKKSQFVLQKGFNFHTLKTRKDLLNELVLRINVSAENKRFEIDSASEYGPEIFCKNFQENVDLTMDIDMINEKQSRRQLSIRRINLDLKHPPEQIERLRKRFGSDFEYKFKYYKVYWPKGNSIKIYRDQKGFPDIWNRGSDTDHIKGLLKGGSVILKELKKNPEFLKIK
jgi:hypothetical protein